MFLQKGTISYRSNPSLKMVTIANAQGFWGDSPNAAKELVERHPNLNYLTLDYLAEVSLSIMAIQREKDPSLGYAQDFLSVVDSLQKWNGTIITNAGGLNPKGCAEACKKIAPHLKIACITGDDVLPHLSNAPFPNLDTNEPLPASLKHFLSANAYIGAAPIVKALQKNPQIIIAGRVADPSLTVAPAIFTHNWSPNDFNKIAGATIAGHLIECGRQVTGGISTDWLSIDSPESIEFPIVDIDSSGNCTLNGNFVTEQTVKEQLLYEIGDPGNYLSPDVTVSFLDIEVQEFGKNKVQLTGAKGSAPSSTYKVNATYRDGWRCEGMLAIFGDQVEKKARKCGEVILRKINPERSLVECIGAGDLVPGIYSPSNLKECMLRIAIADPKKEVLERFAKEIAPMVTAGPPGTTGYSAGRPPVRPVVGFWPTLIEKEKVTLKVEIL